MLRRSDGPLATIGLSLGLSPATLDLASAEPLYVIVTARVVASAQPAKPVTIQTLPTALDGIPSQAFTDLICTTDDSKHIKIRPLGPPQFRWDEEDLRGELEFVTVPAKNHGVYIARHEVPRWRIENADPKRGERYRLQIVPESLEALWWSFASLEELENVRLKTFQTEARKKAAAGYTSEQVEDRKSDLQKRFGDMPVSEGEDPSKLEIILENEAVELEVA